MASEMYIWIPNWFGPEGFQHYKERDPIWIKNYTRLLSHDEYGDLSMHRRGVLHGLWMEYARSNRQLSARTSTLTRRLGQRVMRADLVCLNHAGFITIVDSATLARCLHDASDPLALARRARTRSQEAETEKRKTKAVALDAANSNGLVEAITPELKTLA